MKWLIGTRCTADNGGLLQGNLPWIDKLLPPFFFSPTKKSLPLFYDTTTSGKPPTQVFFFLSSSWYSSKAKTFPIVLRHLVLHYQYHESVHLFGSAWTSTSCIQWYFGMRGECIDSQLTKLLLIFASFFLSL